MFTIFTTTVNQMLVLFLFIITGFVLNKRKLLDENAGIVLSKLETYVIVPVLVFSVFSSKCTLPVLKEKLVFFFYGTIILIFVYCLACFLSKFFAKDLFTRNIYTYSFTIANIGFMGYAVVGAVFGEDALFNMMIFCLPYNIFIYTIGMILLIPSHNKISFKIFLNPVFIAMFLGAGIGITAIPIPQFLNNAISSISGCMAPIAMILTGFIIAHYNLKDLLTNAKIYYASIIRLILIPLLVILILKGIGIEYDILCITLSALAMPLGLNTIIFPAAYGGDTTTGAGMALISHVLAVLTIPIMFQLLL